MNTLAVDLTATDMRFGLNINGKFSEYINADQANFDKLFFFLSDFLNKNNVEIDKINRIVVCNGPGNFNGIRASISAMKGVCCSLPIQLVGVNKFEALAKMNQPSLVSVKYRDNKVYWCLFNNQVSTFMSSSEIEDIKTTKDYSDLIVIGYRAREIAKRIKVKRFVEKNEVSVKDFLNYSSKIVKPEKFLPKPLYISPGQSLFAKYKGPKILDKSLDAS